MSIPGVDSLSEIEKLADFSSCLSGSGKIKTSQARRYSEGEDKCYLFPSL